MSAKTYECGWEEGRNPKALESGTLARCPKAGEDGCVHQREFALPPAFCFIQALNRLDDWPTLRAIFSTQSSDANSNLFRRHFNRHTQK